MLKLGTIKQYSAAYPGYSGKESLQQISWDEFFEKFEESQLAFLYQDEKNSRFSKLVKRDTVEVEESGQPSARPVKASSREDPLQTLERDHQLALASQYKTDQAQNNNASSNSNNSYSPDRTPRR